ncbi:MAG: hypothetical protein PF448_09465 [Bacteroidales bacterium]|jgi:hypothetical protein|nr:hypothetical protein [Bacteroidales bacterium]
MKNIGLFLLICVFLCSSFVSDEISKSKQIQVTYVNYAATQEYKTSDYFSNEKCQYEYLIADYRMHIDVDFEQEMITSSSTFYEKYANTDKVFSSFDQFEKRKAIDTLYNPNFTITPTEKSKVICGIQCENIILSNAENVYSVWYFKPERIKNDRIYTYIHTYFEDVPGVILEINLNGDLVKQAVSVES